VQAHDGHRVEGDGARELVRSRGGGEPTVAEFWDGTYLPFAEKNLRHSTVHSYENLWERHLKPHFGDARLATYRSADATAFLSSLSARLGRNSVNHVRSLRNTPTKGGEIALRSKRTGCRKPAHDSFGPHGESVLWSHHADVR